jgi:hypothetical protein
MDTVTHMSAQTEVYATQGIIFPTDVKLSLWLMKHHAIKTYWGVEV